MKNVILALLSVTLGTLWLLNFFSGIIGGIWLAFSGGLSLVFLGILAGFVMPFIYSLVSFLPNTLLAGLLTWSASKNHKIIGYIIAFITSTLNNFILSIWVSQIFGNVEEFSNYLPSLAVWLWGYSVVMSPIGYMAGKEGRDAGEGTTMGVLFTQLAYFTFSLNWFLGGDIVGGAMWVWLLILLFTFSTMWTMKKFFKVNEYENTGCNENPDLTKEIAPITNDQIQTDANDLDELYEQAVGLVKRSDSPSVALLQRELNIGYSRSAWLYDQMIRNGVVEDMAIETTDEQFEKAVELVNDARFISASLIQRRLKVGYAKAARLLDQLEKAGIVGPSTGDKPRKILIPHNEHKQWKEDRSNEYVWACEYCGEEFDTKEESDTHEVICRENFFKANSKLVEKALEAFDINVKVAKVQDYKDFTKYCLELALGVSIDDHIEKHTKEIALALASSSGTVEVQGPIPGTSLVGVIVPKKTDSSINLKSKPLSEVLVY